MLPISARLKEINLSAAKKFGVQIIEQETDLDHIHTVRTVDITPVELTRYDHATAGNFGTRFAQESLS